MSVMVMPNTMRSKHLVTVRISETLFHINSTAEICTLSTDDLFTHTACYFGYSNTCTYTELHYAIAETIISV
jgi:hypothetical protein